MAPTYYLYGVIDCRTGEPSGLGAGVAAAPVQLVRRGPVGVLFSEVPCITVVPSRREVLAHEGVLERAAQQATVLPVAFGTIAESRSSLLSFLQQTDSKALDLCDYISGKVELGLKIFWLPEAVRQELQSERRIASQPGPQAAVEVGRAVAELVDGWRQTYGQEVLRALRPLAVDMRENSLFSVQMLTNAAFLVEKQRAADFEARVYELDSIYADRLKLKLATGLPLYSFVDLRVAM